MNLENASCQNACFSVHLASIRLAVSLTSRPDRMILIPAVNRRCNDFDVLS